VKWSDKMLAFSAMFILAHMMVSAQANSVCDENPKINSYCLTKFISYTCVTSKEIDCQNSGSFCHFRDGTDALCSTTCTMEFLNTGKLPISTCGTGSDDHYLYTCNQDINTATFCPNGCSKGSIMASCTQPFCESKGDGFYKKTDDPKGIILCKDGEETAAYECPDGTEFNEDTRDCQQADKPEYPSCTVPGLHAVPADCKKYSECVTTKDGFVQRYLECGDDEMFNEETQQCSDPCSWNNPVFRCSEQGRFADPMDCGQYVTCVDIGPQTFKRYVSSCPPGYHFNPDKGRCESTSTYSTCKAKTPTKCDTSTCG